MIGKEKKRQYYLANRQRLLAAARARYEARKDEVAEYSKRRYAEKGDEIKARNNKYRIDNIEKVRIAEARYREKNREKRAAAERLRRQERRQHVYVTNANQRARRKFVGGVHTVEDRLKARDLQGGLCAYSKYGFSWCDGHLERGQWDHIVALAAGGTNDPDNGQWLCKPCNVRKRASSESEFLARHGALIMGMDYA